MSKVKSPEEFAVRQQRITNWQRDHPTPVGPDYQKLVDLARAKAKEIANIFDQSVDEIRRRARVLHRTKSAS
jgi:hypothetical protein